MSTQLKVFIIILFTISISVIYAIISINPSGLPMKSLDKKTYSAKERLLTSTMIETYDGESVDIQAFIGKPLVINSWAAWCPYCIRELPDFATLQQEFSGDVMVIAINRKESRRKANSFTQDLDIEGGLNYFLDKDDSFYRDVVKGFAMPETLFVNADGVIVKHKRGFMELDEMRELTRELLMY